MPTSLQYTVYGHDGCDQFALVLRFSGQRKESATGYYLLGNGYRAFNPVLMRFHSPDSLSPMGAGGLNCYAYCGGDPVNNTDPTGHIRLPSIRLKAGNAKGGYSFNPDFKTSTLERRVVSPSTVATVNALGRGYGSRIEPIINAPVWTDPEKLLVQGTTLKVSSNYGENLKRAAGLSVHSAATPIGSQSDLMEALNVLAPLNDKMQAAETHFPRVSWLHDPKRIVPAVRRPHTAG
ncbi:RHS repeat-associated core domain-containing protein [Pseudomonas kurunegalensis]|uniref:RHS repeat-associated core domain-containing protein n=1 Tax=Pseudomonas kurunegalensis TaxID=485880 RepID=UPI003B66BE85